MSYRGKASIAVVPDPGYESSYGRGSEGTRGRRTGSEDHARSSDPAPFPQTFSMQTGQESRHVVNGIDVTKYVWK